MGAPSLLKIPLPKASGTGLWGAGTHLLLQEDMEGHEREEAEVCRHGDTAAAVLWMGTRQSLRSMPPLLWGGGVLGVQCLLGPSACSSARSCPPTSPPVWTPWSPPADGRGARSAW